MLKQAETKPVFLAPPLPGQLHMKRPGRRPHSRKMQKQLWRLDHRLTLISGLSRPQVVDSQDRVSPSLEEGIGSSAR